MPVNIIDTLKPKNNGSFPVVEAVDVKDLNYVSPEMYGAKGDGTTDDSDAIQAMLNNGNVSCVFCFGKEYKISRAISLKSNTIIDLNNCTIHSTYNGHIFAAVESGGSVNQHNITIKNGYITGSGANNNVGDQGAGVLGFNVDNIYLENLTISNTYGDGICLRKCNNANVINCNISNFGRNGISPTSGRFYINGLNISNTPLTGANPGNTFDCEPNSTAEPANLYIINSIIPRITFVDFYSSDDDDYLISAYMENVKIGTTYAGFRIQSTHKTIARSITINNCDISVESDSSGITINNVKGVCVEKCHFSVGAFSTSHAVNFIGSTEKTKIKDIDLTGWARGIFAYDNTITDCIFENYIGGIYATVLTNNIFTKCYISSFNTNGAISDSKTNTFVETSIPSNLENYNFYGNSKGQSIAGTFITKEEDVRTDFIDHTISRAIKLPASNSNSGHCYLLSIGYSHRGRIAYSGYMLCSVLVSEANDLIIDTIYNTGDKSITLSESYYYVLTESKPDDWENLYYHYYTESDGEYTPVPQGESAPEWQADTYYERKKNREIIATFDANYHGTISYSLLG